MIEELQKVVSLLETVQVDGRFWLTMIACTNSLKQIVAGLENPAPATEEVEE